MKNGLEDKIECDIFNVYEKLKKRVRYSASGWNRAWI